MSTSTNNTKSNPTHADPVMERLKRWMSDGGCDVSKLEVRSVPGQGRCLYAAKRLRPSEIVFYVPPNYMLTSRLGRQSEIGEAIAKANLDSVSNHTFVAAYMLQEKRNRFSFWQHYLESLPTQFDDVPLFFDAKILHYLRGSTVVERALNRRFSLTTEYHELARAIPAFRIFSVGEFLWARTAITTRCFGTTIDGQDEVAMLPLLDMFNHDRHANTRWGPHLTGMAMTAKRAFKPGEQVCGTYGEKNTTRYFASYGFVTDDRETDDCSVTVHLDYNDPLYNNKFRLLGECRFAEFALRACYDKTLKNCLAYLRFIAQERLTNNETAPRFISVDNEIAALQGLIKGANKSLARYDTSLEEDQQLLEGKPIEDNRIRHCIALRSREKIVLHHLIAFATDAIAVLKTPAQVKQRSTGNVMLQAYLMDVW
jgi:hypothetical protein